MKREIFIREGQWVSEVINEIPTNCIFNKTLTGCGATTMEIKAARNSIIIEPNLPAIIGKAEKHPGILAVYEGVTKNDVKAYLTGEHSGYRKILTTPEGFDKKVILAMRETGIDVYNDYFLLFDECEKTIQDVEFRGDIYLPVEDFFEFKGKAMISATPIVPSDPRFRKFDILRLVPTFAYKRDITVCVTNNTIRVLRTMLERCAKRNKKVCIFFNSIDVTLKIIHTLKLDGRCKVFCSEKSVKRLKQEGFKNTTCKLSDLAEVNFFTSRFYSAVDIDTEEKPVVVILTDVYNAPFSAIDPATEGYQAVGRFRNGVDGIYHITNCNNHIDASSQDAVFHRLNSLELAYRSVEYSMNGIDNIGKAAIQQALDKMEYHRFIHRGKRNYFMWDNAWEDEKIRGYYKDKETIMAAYEDAPFRAEFVDYYKPVSDEDRLRFTEERLSNTKALWQEGMSLLDRIGNANVDKEAEYLIDELNEEFEMMIKAHTILGPARIAELGYNKRRIEAAMGEVQENQLLKSEPMLKAVYGRFNTGDIVSVTDVTRFMKEVIESNGIPYKHRFDRKLIELYFEISDKRTNSARYYVFGKKKLNI